MKERRGYTLIELLAVVAIIAVMLCCMVPALLGARASARRVGCLNNLKQIILAIEGYRTTNSVLPSGCYAPSGPVPSEPGGYRLSWVVSILPFMEQRSLYETFDFDAGGDDLPNATARRATLTTLTCPSDGGEVWDVLGGRWIDSYPPGTTSFAGCHHDVEAPIDVDNHGVFFLNSKIRVVDVTDGLSQTIFFGETLRRSPLGWISGTRATLRNTGHPINGLDASTVRLVGPVTVPLPDGLTPLGLEAKIDDPAGGISPYFVGGFGSRHPGGGANFAFGDSSVRFIKQTIDRSVYQRLGHRSDGEVIDDEAY